MYNAFLHRYMVIGLKNTEFKPEYALRDIVKPIGVSDYELGQALPSDLRSSLPSIEEIEAELE